MALMKQTIFFFFFILIFFWRCIRLPVSCVVLWGKLSGSFVALAPFRALKVTAFLSRVCKKKCISLNMCQHTRLPTYQTCSFIAQLCNIVHSVPFRTVLSYGLIEPRAVGLNTDSQNGLFLYFYVSFMLSYVFRNAFSDYTFRAISLINHIQNFAYLIM